MKSIFQFHNVSFTYPDGISGIQSVNLEIPEGKKIALLGGNGAGKTTLLLHLNGLLKPKSGEIHFHQSAITYKKNELRNLRAKIGFLFQEPDCQLFTPSVEEEIAFGLMHISKDKNWIKSKIDKTLIDFDLRGLANRPPHQLSVGQKKRVALASIVAMEPEVIICDEPTSSLDAFHADVIFQTFENMHKNGTTIIISTHDVDMAYQWADLIVVMHNGTVIKTGNPQNVFSDKAILQKANLKQPMILNIFESLFETGEHTLPKTVDELKIKLKELVCQDL